jgi:SAM-dependent methyltransferase
LNLDVDSSKFPFSNNYFDLVVSIWGVEHFKTTNFLGELKRCLKPGGYFIFITPNIFSPIFLANKLLPFSTLNFLRKNIFKIQGNDPAYYKFNNYFTIKNKSNIHGLKIEKLFFIGPANIVYYYPQNRIIQKGIFLVEHSITNRFMFWLKPTIVGVLKKSVNS